MAGALLPEAVLLAGVGVLGASVLGVTFARAIVPEGEARRVPPGIVACS